MTNERKITNEEIKALAEKYNLAAADIEKGIEELEAENIFLSADYIEEKQRQDRQHSRVRQTQSTGASLSETHQIIIAQNVPAMMS